MISIITPVYNSQRFIEDCIKNVVDQNCQNLEHIIVDGQSTDGTVEIVKAYAAQYPHIRWVSEPDLGQSDAINKGILRAKGDVIGILNADDYYEPGVLQTVFDAFNDYTDPTFLVGRCNVWSEQNALKYIYEPRSLRLYALLLGQRFHPTPVNPVGYFYHKSLHDSVGLYDIEETYAMDFDFIYRAISCANVKKTRLVLGNFRYYPHTKTHQNLVVDSSSTGADVRSKYIQEFSQLQKLYFKLLLFYNQVALRARRLYFSARSSIKALALKAV